MIIENLEMKFQETSFSLFKILRAVLAVKEQLNERRSFWKPYRLARGSGYL
jgi:hypothetical protein